jgi:hypothetical protein
MKFVLDAVQAYVSVDGASVFVPATTFPGSYALVMWDGTRGTVQVASRQDCSSYFTDPSPYQYGINAWLTAAGGLAGTLSLLQAQSVKQSFLDTLYAAKRAALTVAFGPYLYDGSDLGLTNVSAIAAQTLLSAPPPPPPSVTRAAATYSSGTLYVVQLAVGLYNPIGTTMLDISNGTGGTMIGSSPGVASFNYADYHSVGISDMVIFFPPPPPVTALVTPSNGPQQNLTGSQLSSLLGSILSSRATLLNDYQTLTANLAATTTISGVAAFDVTTGWA